MIYLSEFLSVRVKLELHFLNGLFLARGSMTVTTDYFEGTYLKPVSYTHLTLPTIYSV